LEKGQKPELPLREHLGFPLLLECDSKGRVLWMSSRTRELLGEPRSLSDIVLVSLPSKTRANTRYRVFSWHFWRVWESGDSVLLGMRAPQLPDRMQAEFLRLEGRFVRSFIRLVDRERRLSEGVRRRRGNGGRKAIRQIEMERRRVGRELHTGVGQTLAAIRLQLEIIGSEMPLPPPGVMQALESISSLCINAMEQVRSVSKKLHPPEWQRLTLEEAIRQLWDLSGIQERFDGELKIVPLPKEPDPEVKALLYRTIQESLSNIVRHAKATRIDVDIRPDGDRVRLTVSDNGVGFDVAGLRATPASVTGGLGLRSIQDLVTETGGNFDIESGPLGTKLVVSVVLILTE
jgi:signal transduction histidine kinase